MKRDLDMVVISDVHIGSFGCHAEELNIYLKSINPKKIILLGDIIDGYVFDKKNFNKHQVQFFRIILDFIKKNVEVYYLTGNHDDFLRQFDDFEIMNFKKVDKLVLEINDKKYWFFHGDVFDISMKGTFGKLATSFGGKAYDLIIIFNRWLNVILKKMGKSPFSLSKKIKDNVKKAVKFVSDFEKISCEHAINQKYDFVINGHIHQPQIKEFKNEKGSVVYMNSGDWIENLSSLEFDGVDWKIHYFNEQ